MNRTVQCKNCNKRLYGNDTVIVENSSRFGELFCSKLCIKKYYGEVLSSKLATKPISVNQYWNSMKAEIISAKAVRFIDIDNLEHTALVEDVKECLIERDGKKLKYFVKISNFLGVFGIDHDTYNFLLALIKESVEVCSKKPVMETWETSSKEIAFIDADGEKHTVLAKDVQGLSLAKIGNHLEYFVKLFSEGYYSMQVSSKTYYILLATLKSFAKPKE